MADTNLYLLRFSGEVGTKARNTRRRFTDRLVVAIEDALMSAGIEPRIDRRWSRLFVHAEDPRAESVLRRVFGIVSLSPAIACQWTDLEDLVAQGREFFAPEVAGKRFAVRARRTTGRPGLPFDSPQIERALGAALFDGAAGVDLTTPEVTAGVEVHGHEVYFFARQLGCPGGLPMGVEGRALALISGGFDSAVAAWEAWKRGVGLDFVFFNLGGSAHEQGAAAVVERLTRGWAYGDWPRLYTIDLQPLVVSLQATVEPRYWQLALKAMMYQAAAELAAELGLPALVTGEALGQVSSQTLSNLALLDGVVATPVLRPLLTWNKEEIVAASRRIGTYERSAVVPEFCALAAKQAMTRARKKPFARMLATLDPAALTQAVAARGEREPRAPARWRAVAGALDVENLPADATFIDLRQTRDYKAWHWPGALNLEYFTALEAYGSVDPAQRYVLYCEVGMKSAHLAELMQAAGLAAQHVPAGVRALRRVADAGASPLRD